MVNKMLYLCDYSLKPHLVIFVVDNNFSQCDRRLYHEMETFSTERRLCPNTIARTCMLGILYHISLEAHKTKTFRFACLFTYVPMPTRTHT